MKIKKLEKRNKELQKKLTYLQDTYNILTYDLEIENLNSTAYAYAEHLKRSSQLHFVRVNRSDGTIEATIQPTQVLEFIYISFTINDQGVTFHD